MSESGVRGLSEWTDEEAKALASDLVVPEEAPKLKRFPRTLQKGKVGERVVTITSWQERCRVTFVGGPRPKEKDKYEELEPEEMHIGLQVVGETSDNKKKLLPFDRMTVWSGLKAYTQDELAKFKAAGKEPESRYMGLFWAMKINAKRCAEFLMALGYHEILVNRRHFPGFARVATVAAEFKNQEVMAVVEFGEEDDGEERFKVVGYAAVNED